MSDAVVAASDAPATPIRLVAAAEAEGAIEALPAPLRGQARLGKFRGKSGETLTLAGEAGRELVLAGVGDGGAAMPLRALPGRLQPDSMRSSRARPDPRRPTLRWPSRSGPTASTATRRTAARRTPSWSARTTSTSATCALSPTPARSPAT